MADALTPDLFRGLLIPDPRFKNANLSSTDSTYTQAGPQPGIPEDQGVSRMVLESSGVQSVAKTLKIEAVRGGYPGLFGRNIGYLWYYGSEEKRGWNAPNSVWGFEWLGLNNNAGDVTWAQPHAIKMSDNRVLIAFRHDDTTQSDPNRVGYGRLSTAEAWSTQGHLGSVTPIGDDGHNHPEPALLELPNGRILLFFWVVDNTLNTAQVQVWYSDSGGDSSTFSLATKYALETAVDITGGSGWNLRRIRVAYNNGQILLVAHLSDKAAPTDPDTLLQCASDDLGQTFSQIEILDHSSGDDAGQQEVIALAGGGFIVLYAKHVGASTNPGIYYRKIGSAYAPLSDATETVLFTSLFIEADGLFAWRGEDDALYLGGVMLEAGNVFDSILRIHRSSDEGETWVPVDDGSISSTPQIPRALDLGEAGTYIKDVTAVSLNGRVVAVHSHVVDGGGTYDAKSLSVMYLGGSSTVTMPSRALFQSEILQHGFLNTYLPFEVPGTVGHYTKTTAGGTETITDGGLRTVAPITTGTLYYTKTGMSSSIDDCLVVLVYLTSVGGVSNAGTTRQRNITLRAADNTEDYEVRINIGAADFECHDIHAGSTQIDSTVTVDSTGGLWVLAALKGANFSCWYRTGGPSADLEWTAGPDSTGLTDGGGGTADFKVEWGTVDTSGIQMTTDWLQVAYGVHVGIDSLSEGIEDADLFFRNLTPTPALVNDGVKVRAISGPAVNGDSWHINTRYEYPIERVDPAIAASPRSHWRSTDETENIIAWDIDALDEAAGESELLGIALFGINFTGATVHVHDGSSWQSLGTLDARVVTGLDYVRAGESIYPSGTSTDQGTGWIQYHELVGGSVKLDGSTTREILHNEEGRFHKDGQQVRIYLKDAEAGDPGSGASGEIWSPNVCLVVSQTVAATWKRLKITIPAQTTAHGYFKIGTAVIGRVYPFKQYSHGRSVELHPNVDRVVFDDGTEIVDERGPARRRVSFAWREGIDTSSLWPSTGPDYYAWSNNRIGVPASTPLTLEGIFRRLNGSKTPVVYLPRISSTDLDFRQREELMLCRVEADFRRESVLGDERENEVFRVLPVTLSEVV